jgi:hypothetical protein
MLQQRIEKDVERELTAPVTQLSSSGNGVIKRFVGCVVVYEAWYRNFESHGEHGPAVIERDAATGAVTSEVWMKRGKLHRVGAPAMWQRDARTGVLTRESWYVEGKRQRAGNTGPAFILRDGKTGRVLVEEWWINDTKIRPIGRIGRAVDGAIDAACDRLGLP